MALSTALVTLNPAFLQEIKEDNQELHERLRDLKAICAGEVTLPVSKGKIVAFLHELRDQLAMHFALEEAYGYFDDPVTAAPQLARRAAELKGEHGRLFLKLVALCELADKLRYHEIEPVGWSRLSQSYLQFHDALGRHEAAEYQLIQDALENDLGVGD
jgi:hypothetical protein